MKVEARATMQPLVIWLERISMLLDRSPELSTCKGQGDHKAGH
jgi:hypothetical protein